MVRSLILLSLLTLILGCSQKDPYVPPDLLYLFKSYPVGKNPTAIKTGDFNQDGFTDLITSNISSNSLSILFGNGDGSFQNQVSIRVCRFQAGPTIGLALVAIRIFGASIVVPIMEELFWRSFLIRYIIHSNFESVRLGTFTAGSFLFTVVLFGLEHNLWLAGMMAGVAYNALLYRTGRLWPCIIAHAFTNLALGIHVLMTGEWHWW